MSTRLKERGGAGAKIMASNPHRPTMTAAPGKENPCVKPFNEKPPSKDNPRSISRGRASTEKVPSISVKEKPRSISRGRASSEQPASVRWSTSSMPVRGKPSNPSSFPKILSDLRGDKVDRKSVGFRGLKLKDENNLGKIGEKAVGFGVKVEKSSGKSAIRKGNDSIINNDSLEISKNIGVSVNQEACKISESTVLMLDGKGLGHVQVGEVGPDRIRVFENAVDKKTLDDVVGGELTNEYPSKLREKLALLEGKVQKIASVIKRTQEMLDQNNPVESKLIITDIQKKISGIEKAVGHAIDGSKIECLSETAKVNSIVSAKGLNYEELEARFFPHHRLFRNQTLVGSSGEKDGSLSPIDENPVALEFLASLNGENNVEKQSIAVKENGMEKITTSQCITNRAAGGARKEITLTTNEKLNVFDEQENNPIMVVHETIEEDENLDQLLEIGRKSSTSGWFVSEGEAVLLAHDDGSCSYYDIANLELKAEYKPPAGVSNNLWGDCWLIRAPGPDGCSGRYVIAASAGNSQDSGFCSWDFYTKEIKAFQVEPEAPSSFSARSVLAPIPNMDICRQRAARTIQAGEASQWWYRPCGPLLISTASWQKSVSAYDIRDGDMIMKWEVNSPVIGMEYSSPLQWRSRGKLILAGTEAITLWDVNSLNPQPLLAVPSGGKVYSLHVNNTDAEVGGGVRQRVSSSEVEGNDGVFTTQDSINVFDFRLPSGIGLKISRPGADGHSIFSRGDSIYIGCTEGRASSRTQVQHYSLRKGKLAATYALSTVDSHIHHSSISQVWGNSNLVMGVCGMGLFVFDALTNDLDQSKVEAKEAVGPDNLYLPTFDYLGSRVLIISRDRPALWRYLV